MRRLGLIAKAYHERVELRSSRQHPPRVPLNASRTRVADFDYCVRAANCPVLCALVPSPYCQTREIDSAHPDGDSMSRSYDPESRSRLLASAGH